MRVFRYCESRLQEIIKINLKQPGLAALKSEEEEAWRRQLAQSLHLTANQIYLEIQVGWGWRGRTSDLTVIMSGTKRNDSLRE